VEIYFRDEYLARADMWRLSISELSNRTVYRGQRLLFMNTIRAVVKNVYISGQSKHSGFFSSMTKPVFRSESARYVLFIQMSQEMWNFDTEGAGEIMFNKVVNGFLPDLFKRWLRINAKHLVTIILFTRMSYDDEPYFDRPDSTTNNRSSEDQSHRYRDYYRVVVSDMASGDWINILYQLKKEFRAFLRDVSLVPRPSKHKDAEPVIVLSGRPSDATHGNILEAINLAGVQFAKDYIDRDLVRTGISVVVITAGTGVFEVDYNMLKLTTDTLVGSGIGIDLVCLSPMPLHSVPLFKYRSPRLVSSMKEHGAPSSVDGSDEHDDKTPRQYQPNFGPNAQIDNAALLSVFPPIKDFVPTDGNGNEWRYAMPHWVDISFWSGPSDELVEFSKLSKPNNSVRKASRSQKKGNTFALRCRMYELQMMGVMENELGDISIPYMEEDSIFPHQLREHTRRHSQGLHRKPTVKPIVRNTFPTQGESRYTEDEIARNKSLHTAWMEAYDDQVFSPLVNRQMHAGHSKHIPPINAGEALEHLPKDSLSASYQSHGPSLGRTARPAESSFHQLMRERSRESDAQPDRSGVYHPSEGRDSALSRAEVLYRQGASTHSKELRRPGFHQRGNSGDFTGHRTSRYSTPTDSPAMSRENTPPKRSGFPPITFPPQPPPLRVDEGNRSANWFLRQISFGSRAAAPAKTISTSSIETGKVEPVRLTVENNQKGEIAAKLASTRATEAKTPSRPINIRSTSRSGVPLTGVPSPDHTARSVDTVRGAQRLIPPVPSQLSSVTKDPGSTFLVAGSRALVESIGPKLNLSSSGGAKDIPRTISPTHAIAPWAVLVNPCNPKKNNLDVSNQFRRWQHVFPKRMKTSSVKWKSLCSPAAVPLTNEYFPSVEQLATEYNEGLYKITQNDDDDLLETPKSRESLVRELIAFRLSHGFQIIVGAAVAEFTGGREQDIANILHADYMSHDGDTILMSVGNTIHQLVCVAGGEVEVKRFSRKPTTAVQFSAGIDTPFPYRPFIRTALEDSYQPRDVVLRPPRNEYNWNFIDTFLAGYHEEFSDTLRFWRARFVLIPVELPTVNRRPLAPLTEDSEEEIRLEGIRKLTQLWQRFRYIPPEERHFQATTAKKQKDPNPLAIEYHTRDPSAIVAAGPDSALLSDIESEFQTALFTETEQYSTFNIDIKKLADDLQGDKGIRMLDRRWHLRLHYNCFLGFDLTSWLLSNFKDVETRDEAVDLGNQLMNKGLFQHVQKRHQFRDGNFFYQIAAEYRAPRPDTRTGWFGMRRSDRSVPSTPLTEGPRTSPLAARSTKPRPSTGDSSNTSGSLEDGERTPTRETATKRKVTLSRVMRYDVDPRKRSYRSEIISLHYDRLSNPDNCYHIRIDWMNVTAKLIEDAIVSWATSVEKYGLKLVEVPIAEASNIVDHHPFRSPYIIKLALQPPQPQPEMMWDTSHFSPQPRTDKFAYHKALLRKLNFVLDMEAASAFPPDAEVTYSWGSPDYKYTQFIHRSGLILAQITSEGDFLLLANRLAHNRAKDITKFRPTDPYEHKKSTATPANTVPTTPAVDRGNKSPFSSPLVRPVQDSSLLHTALQERFHPTAVSSMATTSRPDSAAQIQQTPEQIKDEIETFCTNAMLLQSFYEEGLRQAPSPSPRLLPVLDHNIPSLGLPPAISIREASPAATPGWGGGVGIASPRMEMTKDLGMGVGKRTGSEGSGGSTMSPGLGRRTSIFDGISILGNGLGGGGSGSNSDGVPKRQDSQSSTGTGGTS
jgi:hypothetical protein